MDTTMDDAKQMFFDYACNKFFMRHDGVIKKYESFNISKKQELEWRNEYIKVWLNALSLDDMTAVNRLRDAHAHEALPELINNSGKGDGYSKFWYADAICSIAQVANVSSSQKKQAMQTAIDLWRSLTMDPIQISDKHRISLDAHLASLNASTAEEYLLNYAKRKIVDAKAE